MAILGRKKRARPRRALRAAMEGRTRSRRRTSRISAGIPGRGPDLRGRAQRLVGEASDRIRPRERPRRRGTFLAGTAAGIAVAYLFDPRAGRARRARLRDRTGAGMRRGATGTRKLGARVRNRMEGLPHEMLHPHGEPKPDMNDVTLAHKVESEVIRRPDVDKGRINVNAENGRIVLRGECDSPDQIREVVAAVRQIPEVREVENLLHVKGNAGQERPDQRIGPPTG